MQFNSLISSAILFGAVIFADPIIFPKSEIAKKLIYIKEQKRLPDGTIVEVKKPGIIPYLLGIFFAFAIPWMINTGYFSYIENVINALGFGVPVTVLLLALGAFIFFVYIGGVSKGKFWSTTISFLGILVLLFVLSPLIGSIQSPEMINEFSSRVGSLVGLSQSQQQVLSRGLLGIRCTFATAMLGSPPPECLSLNSQKKEPLLYGKKLYDVFEAKIGYKRGNRYEIPEIVTSDEEPVNIQIPIYFFNKNPLGTKPLSFKVEKVWIEKNGNETDKSWILTPENSEKCEISGENLTCRYIENANGDSYEFKASIDESIFEWNEIYPSEGDFEGKIATLKIERLPTRVFYGKEILAEIRIHVICSVKYNLSHSTNLIWVKDREFKSLIQSFETTTIPPSNGPLDLILSFEPKIFEGKRDGNLLIWIKDKGKGEVKGKDLKVAIKYYPNLISSIECYGKYEKKIEMSLLGKESYRSCRVWLSEEISSYPLKVIRFEGKVEGGYTYLYDFSESKEVSGFI